MFVYQNTSITAIQFALTGVLLAKWLALVKHRLLKLLIVLHLVAALFAIMLLQSRQDLFNFYFKRGDTVKAKYWAQQIIDCPMKIITSKGIILKEQAEKFINSSPPSQTPSIP